MLLQTIGRFLSAASLATSTTVAALMSWGPPTSEAIELLRFAPYPLLLVPALLAWLLAWTVGWAWRLAATASLALVLGPVMGLTLGSAEPGSQLLRVMTYNIKSYRAAEGPQGFGAIARELAEQNPDVVVMQDASELDLTTLRPDDPIRAWLATRHTQTQGQYLIASRHPLRDCKAVALSPARTGDQALRCTVVWERRAIDVLTVHFLSPRTGLNAARHERLAGLGEWRSNFSVRLAQSQWLAGELRRSAKAQRPLIVAGDLNAAEGSPVVQELLDTGLRDAWSSSSVGWGYTHGHSLYPHLDLLRIDHVLVSPDIGVRRAWVGGAEGSEHRPVIAELWLSRTPG
jgi:endonuclease/exonuclease/phosphatase (EEP) superfamily protein YafD